MSKKIFLALGFVVGLLSPELSSMKAFKNFFSGKGVKGSASAVDASSVSEAGRFGQATRAKETVSAFEGVVARAGEDARSDRKTDFLGDAVSSQEPVRTAGEGQEEPAADSPAVTSSPSLVGQPVYRAPVVEWGTSAKKVVEQKSASQPLPLAGRRDRVAAMREQGLRSAPLSAPKPTEVAKEAQPRDVASSLERSSTPKEIREQVLQQKQAAIANDILALQQKLSGIEKALEDPAITQEKKVKLENATAMITRDIGLKQQESYRPGLNHYLNEFASATKTGATAAEKKEIGEKFLAVLREAKESKKFMDEFFIAFTNEKVAPEAIAIFKEHPEEPIVKEIEALKNAAKLKEIDNKAILLKQKIGKIKELYARQLFKFGLKNKKEYKDALREYVQFVAKVRKQKAMPQATLDQLVAAPEYQEALTVLGLQPKPSKSARVAPLDTGA